MADAPKILITGFPYVRESFFATFRHYPQPQQLAFLLPESWKIKGGKVVYHAPKDSRIRTTKAFFYHSHYPLIGGLLKGWMPAFPLHLWRMRKTMVLVYDCSEPTTLTTLINGFWTRVFGRKHIVASWENIPFQEKWHGISGMFKHALLRLNLALSDGIIAGNKKGADVYHRMTKIPVRVIPLNGVDPVFFQRANAGDGRMFRTHDFTDAVVVTFIGAIGKRKGIHLIVRAFAKIRADIPKARLVIAGSGEYESEIDSEIAENNLAGIVIRFPWLTHTEVRELLAVSDIFLYPSISYQGWQEQFGYAIAEASLMQLPVISTHSGSIEDVVVDGKTGILVEENNERELERAMRRLAGDSGLRETLGVAGRQYIRNHFSQDIIARKFFDFFHEFF